MEAAAESLRLHFSELAGGKKVVFIVGVMADKDVDSMMVNIAPLAEAFIAVRPDYVRAMDVQTLSEKLSRFGVPVFSHDTISGGVEEALKRAGKDGIICALGTFFFSEAVRLAHANLTGGK
jgi:dihydrofolate synthase/folylpolyglutamate synthase